MRFVAVLWTLYLVAMLGCPIAVASHAGSCEQAPEVPQACPEHHSGTPVPSAPHDRTDHHEMRCCGQDALVVSQFHAAHHQATLGPAQLDLPGTSDFLGTATLPHPPLSEAPPRSAPTILRI